MKLLVIGSGGREHAIAKKLLTSDRVTQVFVAPGNPGMEKDGLIPVPYTQHQDLIHFARQNEITYTFVGPDQALFEGIVDQFQAAGLLIFGPRQSAARLEWSKAYAKEIMNKYRIPTAQARTFTDLTNAKTYLQTHSLPVVIKADGLALGKGVVIAHTLEEALTTAEDMLVKHKFGAASSKIVVEEYLEGEEFSLFALTQGHKYYLLPSAQDHKRAYDGDQGPNTGGMGAYAPVTHLSPATIAEAEANIIKPLLMAMEQEQNPYSGVLYAGLINTSHGVKVIEFNARFGDPETQVVLSQITSDFAENIYDILQDRTPTLTFHTNQVTLGVILAAEGYPNKYKRHLSIPSFPTEGIEIYYAGVTTDDHQQLISNGGRVLMVTASAKDLATAQKQVYQALASVDTDGFFYRHDIGYQGLKHE